ncbi:MAG: hypothetical protein AVDCRST_MAG68-242 [uncultured Gemmatimonadetes bacterium]|uniref:Uncharacterized protein n=1 Tax=uncultured Gemmatimonadota bacterium TaxID=203437 RepID=A0A6J4K9H2_9BACT|nr:MAG: hypothetical protein AVDCRST_MAG68-242 [uncultured Gemmatimonadota bacterium]
MRHTRLLLALFLTLLAACDRGSTGPSDGRFGSFQGRWDGDPWHGLSYAVMDGDTLQIVGHRPDPKVYYDEFVVARIRFTGPGVYPVSGRAGHLSKLVGGDAGYFHDAGGTVIISGHDARERTVTGSVSLVADRADPDWRVDGTFSAPVYLDYRDVPRVRPFP